MSNGTTLGAIVTAVTVAVPIGLALRRRPHTIDRGPEQALFDAAIEIHKLSRFVARAMVAGRYTPESARKDVRFIYERELDIVAALERYAESDQ